MFEYPASDNFVPLEQSVNLKKKKNQVVQIAYSSILTRLNDIRHPGGLKWGGLEIILL